MNFLPVSSNIYVIINITILIIHLLNVHLNLIYYSQYVFAGNLKLEFLSYWVSFKRYWVNPLFLSISFPMVDSIYLAMHTQLTIFNKRKIKKKIIKLSSIQKFIYTKGIVLWFNYFNSKVNIRSKCHLLRIFTFTKLINMITAYYHIF